MDELGEEFERVYGARSAARAAVDAHLGKLKVWSTGPKGDTERGSVPGADPAWRQEYRRLKDAETEADRAFDEYLRWRFGQ